MWRAVAHRAHAIMRDVSTAFRTLAQRRLHRHRRGRRRRRCRCMTTAHTQLKLARSSLRTVDRRISYSLNYALTRGVLLRTAFSSSAGRL